MSNVEVKLIREGVGELLKSQGVADYCNEIANQVAANAGEGYETRQHVSDQRVIVNVYTATKEAYVDNLENNTLLHALGS